MNDLSKNYVLNIFKCKNVKTPAKAWDAAGWDFFIPENLTIHDFAKNANTFFNQNNWHYGAGQYGGSPVFFINAGTEKYEIIFSIKVDENQKYDLLMNVFQDKNNVGQFNYNEIMEKESNNDNNDMIHSILKNDTYITKIILDPLNRVLIPSGIKVNLPENVFLKAENKSGIASKRGLVIGSSVVDVDYQGQIHISLINVSNNGVILNAGEKIVQFVPYFQPYMKEAVEFNSVEQLYKNKESQRGTGGFGSSGN